MLKKASEKCSNTLQSLQMEKKHNRAMSSNPAHKDFSCSPKSHATKV